MAETELMPLPGSKSAIWGFFGFPARDGQFIEKDKRKERKLFVRSARSDSRITEVQQI